MDSLMRLALAVLGLVIAGVVAAFPFYLLWFVYRMISPKPTQGRPTPALLAVYLLFVAVMGWIACKQFLKVEPPGKQSEAKRNLGAIFITQVSYFGETNTYAGGPEAFSLLHWEPEGMSKYAYFCGDDFIQNTKGPAIPRSALPAEVGTSAEGFTCAAVGNIDNDPDLDYWIINDAKVISQEPGTDL